MTVTAGHRVPNESRALTAEERRAVAYVATYRRLKSCGPTWGELGRAMRWGDSATNASREQVARRIRPLIAAGYLTATREERSLDVGKAVHLRHDSRNGPLSNGHHRGSEHA